MKIGNIKAKIGEYTDSQGQTKGRYVDVGVLMQSQDGGYFIIMNPAFNPAGVPIAPGKDAPILSVFQDNNNGGGGGQQGSHNAGGGNGYSQYAGGGGGYGASQGGGGYGGNSGGYGGNNQRPPQSPPGMPAQGGGYSQNRQPAGNNFDDDIPF